MVQRQSTCFCNTPCWVRLAGHYKAASYFHLLCYWEGNSLLLRTLVLCKGDTSLKQCLLEASRWIQNKPIRYLVVYEPADELSDSGRKKGYGCHVSGPGNDFRGRTLYPTCHQLSHSWTGEYSAHELITAGLYNFAWTGMSVLFRLSTRYINLLASAGGGQYQGSSSTKNFKQSSLEIRYSLQSTLPQCRCRIRRARTESWNTYLHEPPLINGRSYRVHVHGPRVHIPLSRNNIRIANLLNEMNNEPFGHGTHGQGNLPSNERFTIIPTRSTPVPSTAFGFNMHWRVLRYG